MGQGDGTGRGGGGDPSTGVLAGSIVACCFLFFMFFIGIPLFIAGVVLVSQSNSAYGGVNDTMRTAGIICIVIAVIMVIIGVILIVLTCCLGSRSGRGQPGQVVQPGGQTTIIHSTVMHPGQAGATTQGHVQGGGYPGAYPGGGGGVPPGHVGYAPQPGGGYSYPQAGYPPAGQPYYDPNAQIQKPPPYNYASPSAPKS